MCPKRPCVPLTLSLIVLLVPVVVGLTCPTGQQSSCSGAVLGSLVPKPCRASARSMHCLMHTYSSNSGNKSCWTSVGRCSYSSCTSIRLALSAMSEQSSDFKVTDFQCSTCSTEFCLQEEAVLAASESGSTRSTLTTFKVLKGLLLLLLSSCW